MRSIDYSFMNVHCESMGTMVSITQRGCSFLGQTWAWAAGGDICKGRGLRAQESQGRRKLMFGRSHLLQLCHVMSSPLLYSEVVTVKQFNFSGSTFNSKFSYLPVYPVSICKSFGIDFQFLAGHLHLDVPGIRKTSWLTIYVYHLFESLFSAYRKWG